MGSVETKNRSPDSRNMNVSDNSHVNITSEAISNLARQIKERRIPVNVVISGPPGVDVTPLCSKFASDTGFSHEVVDPVNKPAVCSTTTAVNIDGAVQRPSNYWAEFKRDSGRMRGEIDQNRRTITEMAQSNAANSQHVFYMHSLQISNYTTRHLINVPSNDVLVDIFPSDWARSLWRVFSGSVVDEFYGYVCAATALDVITKEQYMLLEKQTTTAFNVLLKDCSASNTIFVHIVPSDNNYSTIVNNIVKCTYASDDVQSKTFTHDLMWRIRENLTNTYQQSSFTTRFWSLFFNVDKETLSEPNIRCITYTVLEYISEMCKRKLWHGDHDKRLEYLNSDYAKGRRVKYVPLDTNRSDAPHYTHPSMPISYTLAVDDNSSTDGLHHSSSINSTLASHNNTLPHPNQSTTNLATQSSPSHIDTRHSVVMRVHDVMYRLPKNSNSGRNSSSSRYTTSDLKDHGITVDYHLK